MPSLRRNKRTRQEKHKPEVVTGSFELHYEDVVQRNRFFIVAIFASALVLLATFVPAAVYHSFANKPKTTSVEAESGQIINPGLVELHKNDVTASDNAYIEFRAPIEQ